MKIKVECLDCGNIFDIGMIRFSETWFFYCIKCDSTKIKYYGS